METLYYFSRLILTHSRAMRLIRITYCSTNAVYFETSFETRDTHLKCQLCIWLGVFR